MDKMVMGISSKFKSLCDWAKLYSTISRFIGTSLVVLVILGVVGMGAARVEALPGQLVTPANNRAIALQFAVEGWGTNPTWETVWDQLMTNDVVYHFNSTAAPVVGLEANKGFNAELFKGFPALEQTIEDVVVEGDRVVYRATLRGKNTGDFLGVPATGKFVDISGVTWLRMEDNKIVEWWYDCNLLGVMEQLGVA